MENKGETNKPKPAEQEAGNKIFNRNGLTPIAQLGDLHALFYFSVTLVFQRQVEILLK
jgi:hypothetical protein